MDGCWVSLTGPLTTFFFETIKIDPETNQDLFNSRGTSKAKRLRSFIENAESRLVAIILRELWKERETTDLIPSQFSESEIEENFFKIVSRFESDSNAIDSSAIETFEPNETLEELVEAIKRDLDANRPAAGLDRLHTYCMKRFAALIVKYEGGECSKEEALHARVGKFAKQLEYKNNLSQMSLRIIKSSISVFESFNSIRNDKSLAHDNAFLINATEARFIFDSVTAILRFIKATDTQSFED